MAEALTCSRVSGTCPVTCGVCVPDDESLLEPPSDETMGQCYSPSVANGIIGSLHHITIIVTFMVWYLVTIYLT